MGCKSLLLCQRISTFFKGMFFLYYSCIFFLRARPKLWRSIGSILWGFQIPTLFSVGFQSLLQTLPSDLRALSSLLTATNTCWEVSGGLLCSLRLESTQRTLPHRIGPAYHPLFSWPPPPAKTFKRAILEALKKKPLPRTKRQVFHANLGIYYPHFYKVQTLAEMYPSTHDPRISLEVPLELKESP